MFPSTTARRLGALWLLFIIAGLMWSTMGLPWTDWLPEAGSSAGKQLVKQYNTVSHIIFLIALATTCAWLLWKAYQSNQNQPPVDNKKSLQIQLINGVKQHPVVIGLFGMYTVLMLRHTSWFYKEVIGWYKDIVAGHLLDNFSLRWELTKETMFRNDFRFFPLSHQDLHILSWFTPYVKIWMLVNAAELFLIAILGAKIIKILSDQSNRQEILLMFSILFLFDDATGFTFFQFMLIFCQNIKV